MKSRITIELDFDQGNQPVIQILQIDSDDVRDGMVKYFLQSLGHTSRWIKIEYKNGFSDYSQSRDDVNRWHLVPIRPDQLVEEMKLMDATIKAAKKIV